jgi:saccharopine dehydrogenase-like NADP-dependent oxidoreductase
MRKKISTILIMGLGKVGLLVATMLHEAGFKVKGADIDFAKEVPFTVISLNVKSSDELTATMREFDAVVSCLPPPLPANSVSTILISLRTFQPPKRSSG